MVRRSVSRCAALENELRESTWSAQYFPPLFGKLAQEHGVVLENFVYCALTPLKPALTPALAWQGRSPDVLGNTRTLTRTLTPTLTPTL
jgi:hypothetical protein